RFFNLLALRIVFASYLDKALVVVFWLARGAKIAHFNGVPTVVMDRLDVCLSVRRAYEVIPFIQTALFNKTAEIIMRESELGTAVGVPYRTLVLIEEGMLHRIAACIKDSSQCNESALNHDRFAIRAKVGL